MHERNAVPPEGGQGVRDAAEKFIAHIGKVVVGKEEAARLVFLALLCEGHILIEDVPGVGKTRLARASAQSLGLSFRRIQCTPDLLPSDITGVQFFNQKRGEFEFRPGPVMAHVVLVDEINRATPRTQSCLLECMQERQITVDLETLRLPRPFLILATQNPVELEGTFPLPEAQLDRFLLTVHLGYPAEEEEAAILARLQVHDPLEDLASLIDSPRLFALQAACRSVRVDHSLRLYLAAISRETRRHEDVRLGASPRATLGLQACAQARAASEGRTYMLPDDVKALAVPVLAHRLLLKTEARLRGRTETEVVREALDRVSVPV